MESERVPSYWCHQCKKEFHLNQTDVKCPQCSGDFCEEITAENSPVGYVPYEVRQERPRNLTRRIQQSWIINHGPGPIFAFTNQDLFENNYMNNVLEYIRRIDPNRYGTPPASIDEISKLEKVKFEKEHAEKGFDECSICKEAFTDGELLTKMPCNHLNHEDCIVPWLKSHNSCPLCRHELRTDDPDYEQRKQQRQQGGQQQQRR